ncbi:MAG TPA: hypothetical protein VGK80_05375 [Rhodanobacteraceae bacterium]
MNKRILRRGLIGLGVLLAGALAAPTAFARTHVSVGLGFYGPGYSIGINDCVNCYRGYYPRNYYYPAYSAYYPPAYYYRPAPVYYRPAPVYYSPYPVYGTVYYGRSYGDYYHDGHDHDGWHDRDDGWHGDGDDDHDSHGSYYHH